MGYYIQTPNTHGKADWLIEHHGAREILIPVQFDKTKQQIQVCVVDNGPFEAAAIGFDEKEVEEFKYAKDTRPKRWLIITREKALELCPKAAEVL